MALSPVQEKQFAAECKRWLSLYKQGGAAIQAGKHKRAEQLLTDGLKIVRRLKQMQEEHAPDYAELIKITDNFVISCTKALGLLYLADRDSVAHERCLPLLMEGTALLEADPEPNYVQLFDIYDALCQAYVAVKDQVKYEDICRRALRLKEREVGQWDPAIVPYLIDLAWALEEQGKYAECAALKKDALGICENDKGVAHPDVIALKHGVAYTTFLSEGMGQIEAIQKALDTLTVEERKKFTGEVAAELQGMR